MLQNLVAVVLVVALTKLAEWLLFDDDAPPEEN